MCLLRNLPEFFILGHDFEEDLVALGLIFPLEMKLAAGSTDGAGNRETKPQHIDPTIADCRAACQ